MSEYQVISRKYRPQKFADVIGQDAVVTTLKNAIRQSRIAHAYLFSGSRGTGKTTLARLFAKAINCPNLSEDQEPCGTCQTCKEIAAGVSLDVLEIDGASNRGIDDIRKINENVGYATASARYKIYIIDEVHMLTKEAFNALLKTLEEPPPRVKFFFATTEPHKVLPTILSRCQRFSLQRFSNQKIKEKLLTISRDLQIKVEEEALDIIAKRSEGGLRDAESLLDQILSFHEGVIDSKAVADVLGIMPKEVLFELDRAGKEGRFVKAYEIVHALFSQGKDLQHFVEMLTEHYRTLLLLKISPETPGLFEIEPSMEQHYLHSATLYSKEQLMDIIDYLFKTQQTIREAPSIKIALEALLIRIMRTHRSLPIEIVVKRLIELEQGVKTGTERIPRAPQEPAGETADKALIAKELPQTKAPPEEINESVSAPAPVPAPAPASKVREDRPLPASTEGFDTPQKTAPKATASDAKPEQKGEKELPSQQESQRAYEIDMLSAMEEKKKPAEPKASDHSVNGGGEKRGSQAKEAHHVDTLLQFASVELEGRLKRIN